jgi:formylglycine-generating enzyme required for sulfatase activity
VVSFDELGDYVHDEVVQRTPSQTPRKWALDQQGKLVVARVPVAKIKPAALPEDLRTTVEDHRPWVRESAVKPLRELLTGRHPGLALAARAALKKLARDDSDAVKAAARAALGTDAQVGSAAVQIANPVTAVPASDADRPRNLLVQATTPAAWHTPLRRRWLIGGAIVASLISGFTTTVYLAVNSGQPAETASKRDRPQVVERSAVRAGMTPFRDTLRDGGEGPLMIVIPAGDFTMGSPPGETGQYKDEIPQHRVTIKSFALSQTEVTFDDYDRFPKATQRALPSDASWGRGRRPVINVSWKDATAYALWLSAQTGLQYRLPSEAEWEYAARANEPAAFSTGKCISETQANFRDQFRYGDCPSSNNYLGKTQSVSTYPANGFGLHDMHGNVLEWVQDCWHDNYRQAPQDAGAWLQRGGGDCTRRILRGGSWGSGPLGLRSAGRIGSTVDEAVGYIGFRLARTR